MTPLPGFRATASQAARDAAYDNAGAVAAHAPGALVPIPGADHVRVLEALRVPDGTLLRVAATLLA